MRKTKRVPFCETPCRDVDHRNLRSMLKISYAACRGLSVKISAQFSPKICLTAQNDRKIKKYIFECLRLSKVIALVANRKLVYNFLLLINSSLVPI